MKVLLIGGTGTISTPICESLAKNSSVDLYVLNRGNKLLPKGAKQIVCDFNDEEKMKQVLQEHLFDVVINFIVFTLEQAQSQIRLFQGKVKQYIFISTVATYNHENAIRIDESHEQNNRYSEYGRKKTACEKAFLEAVDFPVTIVRPSQTYSKDRIPLSVKGKTCYSVIDRILNDKPVIVHGDGKSTWHSTHADDFAKGFLPLIGNMHTIGEAYHIINDEIATWDMIYHDLYELLGKEPNIVHIPSDFLGLSKEYDNVTAFLGDKQYSCVYDMSKIKKVVPDFECKIMIKEGLKKYLDYIEEHPELKIKDDKYDAWCDRIIDSYNEWIEIIKDRF